MLVTALFTIIAAYLLGSINFAVIFAKAFLKKDVRDLGSGNAGTTNVMRNAGFLPGALTFVFDALKGFAACYIGKSVFDYININGHSSWSAPVLGAYLCGVACIIGHIFPIFFGFKGGKGVATSVGIFIVCCPIAIIVGLSVFAITVLASKYVSLGSVIATVVVVIFSIIFADSNTAIYPQVFLSAVMGVIVIIKHKDNIKRLMNGTESKIGRK